MKYSCLLFGEGGKDKKFLISLCNLSKFQYYTKNWSINYDNASGVSPRIILEQCAKSVFNKSYDLVICFIDLDILKSDYERNWNIEKEKLEKEFSDFKIIWQMDNAEEEYIRVIGGHSCSKHKLNKLAQKEVEKFVNSDFWKRIIHEFSEKERELNLK